MKGNLITLAGTVSKTGPVLLGGQFAPQGVTTITVPLGMKLKIYRFAVSGNPIAVVLLFTPNINSSNPTWYPIEQIAMSAAGEDIHEYRARPIVIYGELGTEAITVYYEGGTGETTLTGIPTIISLTFELTDQDDKEE